MDNKTNRFRFILSIANCTTKDSAMSDALINYIGVCSNDNKVGFHLGTNFYIFFESEYQFTNDNLYDMLTAHKLRDYMRSNEVKDGIQVGGASDGRVQFIRYDSYGQRFDTQASATDEYGMPYVDPEVGYEFPLGIFARDYKSGVDANDFVTKPLILKNLTSDQCMYLYNLIVSLISNTDEE